MARFLFVWMIMIGAMVGVRESTHFEVDVWPRLAPRAQALLQASSRACSCWASRWCSCGAAASSRASPGSAFGAGRAAAVDDPHRLAADRPHLDRVPGRARWSTRVRVLLAVNGQGARMTGDGLSPSTAALILFGIFFTLMLLRVPWRSRSGSPACRSTSSRPAWTPQSLVQETFNAFNSFILLAVPFFLLTANLMNVGGITDRLVRFSRALVGHFPGRAGADQRGAVDLLRRRVGLVDRRRGEPEQDLHRGADQGRLRPSASRWRSPRCRR